MATCEEHIPTYSNISTNISSNRPSDKLCAHPGCRAYAMKDDIHCWFHTNNPSVVAQRAETQSRAGRISTINTSGLNIEEMRTRLAKDMEGLSFNDLESIQQGLNALIHSMIEGTIHPRNAEVLGGLLMKAKDIIELKDIVSKLDLLSTMIEGER
jgi:hypothetical protein